VGNRTMVARYLFAARVPEPCQERPCLWTWRGLMAGTRVVWDFSGFFQVFDEF